MSAPALDRRQREALRSELAVSASGYGDFELAFSRGEREYVVRHLERLRVMVEVADALGWREQPGTPELQPVEADLPVISAWAAEEFSDLVDAMREGEALDPDEDLDALSALRVLAASTGGA